MECECGTPKNGALRRGGFFRIGRDWPLLSNLRLKQADPAGREAAFVTMADSDIDF